MGRFVVLGEHGRTRLDVFCDQCGKETHKRAMFVEKKKDGQAYCALCCVWWRLSEQELDEAIVDAVTERIVSVRDG